MSIPTISGVPSSLTSFIGREREIAAVRTLLGTTRLLTVTGAGGSGKTRLALEIVTRDWGGTPGAWVELAPVRDPALVAEAVLSALGVREQTEALSPLVHLAEIIGTRAFLLVLDNCEHVLEASATLADALLRRCPALQILITSREALGVTGETAWLIPPLTLPDSVNTAASEAVTLFVDRARAVLPAFALTDENRDVVSQICRRLDGMPLAVELAAARLRALTPEQINARLDDRFRLLKTGNRTALPRHQTLRAVIDWSYDLLQPNERLLLDRLAVFRSGATLEAIEAACVGGPIDVDDVLDLIAGLVEKSLVEMREHGDSGRYYLLETVRQYGVDRLAERAELSERQRHHAQFFFSLVQEAEPHFTSVRRQLWVTRLQADLDNIRQVLSWSADNDAALHMRIVGMLHGYWFASGQWPEARQWLKSALTRPISNLPTRDRAAVLFSAGAIACLQARAESALVHLNEAETLAESLGEDRLLAYIRNYRGMSFNQTASADAETPTRLALEWFRSHGDFYGLRLSFLLLGAWHQNRGETRQAIEANEEGVRVARVFGLDRELGIALQCLGMSVMHGGDMRRAVSLLRESLDAMRRDPQKLILARGLEMLASSLASQGSSVEAAKIYGAGETIREMIGAKMWKSDLTWHAPHIAAARTLIGDEAFNRGIAEGRGMNADDAIDFALLASERLDAGNADEPSTNTAEYEVVVAAKVASGPALRVRSLGVLEIVLDGGRIEGKAWGYAKARELLLLLLWHPEGRTREQIGLALWPDGSTSQVRNNFHVTLHHLRKALRRAEWVRFERDRYLLDTRGGVEFDARAFEEGIVRALRVAKRGGAPIEELTFLLDAYRGDFLDGENVGDWHLEIRDRLCRLHSEGLEVLGGLLMKAERFEAAADVYERLVGAEELHEEGYRQLMTARASMGDIQGVKGIYQRLEKVLERDSGSIPSKRTADLFTQLRI